MPLRHIVSDYHRTLFADKDEGNLWVHVGMTALKDSTIGKVPTPRSVVLFLTMLGLYNLTGRHRRGEIGYDYGIRRVINCATNYEFPFDHVIANPLVKRGGVN